jgi:CDP-paratose 2-epimerase
MSTAIVTRSNGLIGSESARHFHRLGWNGVDNDMRAMFFGPEASTAWMGERLVRDLPGYGHVDADVP